MDFKKEAREVQQVLYKSVVKVGFTKSIPMVIVGIQAALEAAYQNGRIDMLIEFKPDTEDNP